VLVGEDRRTTSVGNGVGEEGCGNGVSEGGATVGNDATVLTAVAPSGRLVTVASGVNKAPVALSACGRQAGSNNE